MFNGNTGAITNGIAPKIRLYTTGITAITMSDVVLRNYYTVDGEKSQNFCCDWSSAGSANVTGRFVKMDSVKSDADYDLEIGFTSGAGILATGQNIELRFKLDFQKQIGPIIHKQEIIHLVQQILFFIDWEKMTGYVGGNLAWGVEP